MDWAPTEVMEAVSELADQILSTSKDPWPDLAEAGLLEVEGWLETLTLVRAVGRSTLPVPVLESVVLGAPARAAGLELPDDAVLTAALQEPGRPDPRHAGTHIKKGRLFGEKVAIPAIDRAQVVVVPAFEGLFAVSTADLAFSQGRATDDSVVGDVVLDGVLPLAQLGGRDELDAWSQRVSIGIAAYLLGVAERALNMTAAYVKERKQFGMPIGMFQAVSQRAADAWIDLQMMEVALWRAAWLQEQGEDATRATLVARTLACEGAHRVVAAAQHLHGGMGYDKDYGLYRCFLLAKRWEFVLGGQNRQLAELGRWHRDAALATQVG